MAYPICVALDFETAGYYGHSACAIGLARLENLRITDKFYRLIRPPSSKVFFTNIHGLRWCDLKNQGTFSEVWPDANVLIKDADYIIAHNASFDRGVLTACCHEFKVEYPEKPFLCTLRGTRRAVKARSHSLDAMCKYFNIELHHHHAASDALGCGLIYVELKKLGLNDECMLLK